MNDLTESKEAQDGMVLPKDGLRELALFAGAGGGILGGLLHGWRTVAAVEIEDYPRRVLLQRQADGILPRFPIWDDVQTFDGKPWRGKVDVISGGFPCQDISCAGTGSGLAGSRSGLWSEMSRIIGEVQPTHVFVENSPILAVRGLGDVLGDLAHMGFNARWGVLGAHACGGPIERERVWIAGTNQKHGKTWLGDQQPKTTVLKRVRGECPSFWLQAPSERFGMEHGMDSYVDQVSAIGNGQVPAVAALAWQILTDQTEQA
jgi:DNA (cytosine-5)-methyltransferase 1